MRKIELFLSVLVVFWGIVPESRPETRPRFRTIHSPQHVEVAAHRGANEFAPENTLAAFRKAVELGVDRIEIDVRQTQDGTNIIMHDSSLKRTTGIDGNVGDWKANDLRPVSAGAWYSGEFADERIPTLDEACRETRKWNDFFAKNTSFYVDCKSPDVEKMLASLKEHGFLDTSVFYGNDVILQRIMEVCPEAKRMPSYGRGERLQDRIDQFSPYAFDVSWSLLTPELIDRLHLQNIKVFSDAPRNATGDELRKAIDLGVDLIQTDRILKVYEADRGIKQL